MTPETRRQFYVRRCEKHGPLVGVRYCPECFNAGEAWDEARAIRADHEALDSALSSAYRAGQIEALRAAADEIAGPDSIKVNWGTVKFKLRDRATHLEEGEE